jgi:RND family efflux transporter MFP subunit
MNTIIKIFAGLLILGLILVGFHSYKTLNEKKNEALVENETPIVPVVQVYKIGKDTITLTIPITAEVRAMNEVDIIPKVTGRLEHLRLPDGTLLEEGVSVTKGEQIALIEHSALKAAVNQARAALEVAKASLERAEVNKEDADREMKQWENLFAKGAASEDNRDKAITAYKRSVADVALCERQIDQAQAVLEQSEVNLAEATIAAPLPGVVSVKYVDEGSMVGPQTPLVKIVQIDTVKIIGRISERHIAEIAPGETRVRIVMDAYPDEEFVGTVFRLGVDTDPLTRTLDVETRVSNPGLRLKPGMFARMMIDVKEKKDATVVPDSALIRKENKVFVYKIVDSKALLNPVVTGLSEGNLYEVSEGLIPGEVVVVRGANMLKDGMQVQTKEEEL